MFWNLWCERVRFLNPEEANSSHSETSVGTSSTNSSTLYLIDKRVVIQNGLKQLWYKFGPTTTSNSQINGNNKTTVKIFIKTYQKFLFYNYFITYIRL